MANSKIDSFSFHKSSSKHPNILQVHAVFISPEFICYSYNFLLNVFLTGTLHIDVVTIGTGEMAGNCLPESLGFVLTRPMDEQRMEENGVSFSITRCTRALFSSQSWIPWNILLTPLPLGVIVRLQGALVCSWEHNQTTIVPVDVLHCRPGTNDEIAGPEGEIVQVLVQGMTGRLLARIWRFVYQHCVHGHDIRSVKHSTYFRISGRVQYLKSSLSSWKSWTFVVIFSLGVYSDFEMVTSLITTNPNGFTSFLQIFSNSFRKR